MTRRSFLAVLLSALLSTIAATTHADDLKAMEGKWKVESAEADGKVVDAPELKDILVTITGATYEVVIKDQIDRGSLKIDESQKPRTMDATKTEGAESGKVVKAIYEIKGDTLRVCYLMKEGERPKEFATKLDSQLLLITYRREK